MPRDAHGREVGVGDRVELRGVVVEIRGGALLVLTDTDAAGIIIAAAVASSPPPHAVSEPMQNSTPIPAAGPTSFSTP